MNSTTNDSDRTPGDSHWRDMVNLKERYGHRFKVAYDESYYAERGDHGRAEDARLMVLLCDHGHMYPFGGDLLAASTDKRGAVAGRLAGLDCTTVVQDGDDGVNATFHVHDFEEVAAVMKPRKRKRGRAMTAEEKKQLADRGRAALRKLRSATCQPDFDERRRDAGRALV